MRSTPPRLLCAVLAILAQHTFAAPEDAPNAVAQTFYDGYVKVLNAQGDERRYVLKSEQLTPALKEAYKAYVSRKDPDADPIIQAQDFPKEGFKAYTAIIKAKSPKTATVTMTSRDPTFEHTFKVTLTKNEKGWLISGIGTLKAK
jgi:acyl-coenzyme A synthetase/AMP-(fatty) acid ligase